MELSRLWKLRALLKKNFTIMKRNILVTLGEIIFPIFLCSICLILRKAFDSETYDFTTSEKSLDNFLETRSFANINYNDSETYSSTTKWNGLSVLPPLKMCSPVNHNYIERPKIASIGIPTEIKDRIKNDSLLFQSQINFVVTDDNFQEFESIEEFNKYIQSDDYTKYPLICFGLFFNYDSENEKYKYSIHFFDYTKDTKDGARDIKDMINGLFDRFQSGPDMESYELYRQSTYTYLLKIVNDYILQKETKNENAEINFGVTPMKYIDYRVDSFGNLFGYFNPFFILIAYIIPMSFYANRMVSEKENKSKEGMKIMGLGNFEYFLSYFIEYFIIALIDSLAIALVFKYTFKYIPYHVLFIEFILWSFSVFAMVYFFQSFIERTSVVLVLSILVYIIMYAFSFTCMNENLSKKIKYAMSIFPCSAVNLGNILFAYFQYHFKRFKSKDVFGVYINYNIGIMFLMFFIDGLIFLFLGYYLENVLPHEYGIRKPWNFLCTKKFWRKKKSKKPKKSEDALLPESNRNTTSYIMDKSTANINIDDEIYKDDPDFQKESEIYNDDPNRTETSFRIRNITKRYGDGKVAVKKLNLNFYSGEIFALLGHNGAGKTTLISMLSGMIEATRGMATYENMNILQSSNMEEFRKIIGICPQHDILFADLTVKEHLEMFAIFKGVKNTDITNEVNKILHDFRIEDIQNIIAKNLSAGQRRKLSIAIALIGGSKIIFLDEPSSGMDITSRRNLWEILKRQKEGKIIILTTHYMEEASILGDRIGIINEGSMKCIGTPLFIIERFGKFMSLNITKDTGASNTRIIKFIEDNCEKVEHDIFTEGIMFKIPKDTFSNQNLKSEDESNNQYIEILGDDNNNNSKENKIKLVDFFNLLDNNLNELKIKSYSVSMPTLEDAFLNIAAEDTRKMIEDQRKSISKDDQIEADRILFSSDLKEDFTKKSKFIYDFKTFFKKRFLSTIRDYKGLIMDMCAPVILVLVGLLTSEVETHNDSKQTKMNMSYLGQQEVLFSNYENCTNSIENYFFSYTNVTSKTYNDLGTYDSKYSALKNYQENLFNNILINKEDSAQKEIDMTAGDYIGNYGAYLMTGEDKVNHKYEFIELINARMKHGVPVYTYFMLNKIIENAVGHSVDIDYTHYPVPITKNSRLTIKETGLNIILAVFMGFAFSLIPANFITMLVKERKNNAKHLMKLSGMDIKAFWCVNYIFELIKYYITGGLCLLLLVAFDKYKKYLYIIYILLGPALTSFTYIISFLFDGESAAQNTVILFNVIIGGLCSLTACQLRCLDSTVKLAKIVQYVLTFLPTFLFNFGFDLLTTAIGIYYIEYPTEFMYFDGSEMIKRFNLLLYVIIFLSVETVVYTVILIIIEARSNKNKVPSNTKLINECKDDLVIEEIKKASDFKLEKNRNKINLLNNKSNIQKQNDMKLNNKEEELLDKQADNDFEIEIATYKTGEDQAEINTGRSSIAFLNEIKNTEYFIRIQNLKKVYKNSLLSGAESRTTTAIKNLNFCVEEGECFGLLGLNGAGKTTTFKCLTQETVQSNGKLYINGLDINYNPSLLTNNLIGYCPQFEAIFEYMTVFENLEFYSRIKGVKESVVNGLVTAMINEMSLQEFTNKLAGRLSGGNKRKLSVAIAMIGNPKIILLDEPSNGMDPEARRFMWSVIHKISTKGLKSSIIMTTHAIDEAESLCQRIGIMVNGEFVCMGTSTQIKEKYGYGYEAQVRIKPIPFDLYERVLVEKNLDRNLKINGENINNVLASIGKEHLGKQLCNGGLGDKIMKDIRLNGSINVSTLISWIFFIENGMKFIIGGKEFFDEIVLSEYMDNTFLFKMKKNNQSKTIGFVFGLYEGLKDQYFVNEYSIQQTSLEQIFNKFASLQVKNKRKDNAPADDENEFIDINNNDETNEYQKNIKIDDNFMRELFNE